LIKKRNSSKSYASDLLFPAVALFKSLGMNLQQIQQIVAYTYEKVGNFEGYKKIDQSADNFDTINGDVVSKWIRSHKFLDSRGNPKVLPFKGKNSFSSLVHLVDKKCDPLRILRILVRYKTIKKIRGTSNYQLNIHYYKTNSDDRILINSATSFLWDANKTIFDLLKYTAHKQHNPFWFRAEIDCLAKKDIAKFMTFMRERTTVFMLEADDWLEAHRTKKRTTGVKTVQRVGLGLFTFVNNPLDPRKIKPPLTNVT
jgi:hypothetical protein